MDAEGGRQAVVAGERDEAGNHEAKGIRVGLYIWLCVQLHDIL